MFWPLADVNDLPVTLPNPSSTLLVRPLAVPLALFALVIGFVLWRFMGDVPSALRIGLSVLIEAILRRRKDEREVPMLERPVTVTRDSALTALKARDPAFDQSAFTQFVSTVAQALIAAWDRHDLSACQSFLTSDCWTRQQNQLSRALGEGWRRTPSGLTPSVLELLAVTIDGTHDGITVRIRMVPPAGTKSMRGRRIGEWVEDWTFLRSARPATGGSPQPKFGPWQLDRMDHVAIHFERAAA
jgi:hypothetical protein